MKELLTKFHQNPTKRLEDIGKKHDFWTFLRVPFIRGLRIFWQKTKTSLFYIHPIEASYQISERLNARFLRKVPNLTLGFEDRGQKGLIWAIWGSKGGFSDIKTPTGGRIRIFRGYRQLNSRFKH